MAISFIGQNAVAGNSLSIPTHAAGDLILIWAYRGSGATAITVPSGFTSVAAGAANTNASVLAWKIAASSSEVSGTWTNAELVDVHVYRGTHQTTPIGAFTATTDALTNYPIPALTLTNTSGSSWVAVEIGSRSNLSSPETPPSGMTNRSVASSASPMGKIAGHDTNGGVSSWSGGTGGPTAGFRWRMVTFEILAAPVTTMDASGALYIEPIAAIGSADLSISASGALFVDPVTPIGTTVSAMGASAALHVDPIRLIGNADLSLSVSGALHIADIAALGTLIFGTPTVIDVPPERTYIVASINRVSIVPAINRITTLPPFKNKVTVQ